MQQFYDEITPNQILNFERDRKNGLINGCLQRKYLYESEFVINSLQKEQLLTGHEGCVNTIYFSEYGDYLLTGSDDMHLNIYDFNDSFKLKHRFLTGHEHNIFKAKFFPHTNSTKIISSACDHTVFYTDINFQSDSRSNKFNCHLSIPSEVCVLEREPFIFLVSSTEGSVRQYDIREKTSCLCDNCYRDVIIHLNNQIQNMDICPTRPYECALALSNSQIHFYDRRKVYTGAKSYDFGKKGYMFTLDPINQTRASFNSGFTYIRYSDDGSELLCNYVGDKVIVFSCDFGDKMVVSDAFVRPQCYSRTSYFDTSKTGMTFPNVENIITPQDIHTFISNDVNPRFNSTTFSQTAPMSVLQINFTTSHLSLMNSLRNRENSYSRACNISSIKHVAFLPKYNQVFSGHSNLKTMLKEAMFWGTRYIIAGSDCGRVFIWDRKNHQISQLLAGDHYVVNSLDRHPTLPVFVCSGIDNDIKVFKPTLYNPTSNEYKNHAIQHNKDLIMQGLDLTFHSVLEVHTEEVSDPDSTNNPDDSFSTSG